MMHLLVYLLCVCVVVVRYADTHYTQQWAVHIEGGAEIADQVAADHGFTNLGKIFDDHYHFSHSGVAKRSLAPNLERRVSLAVDTRVQWAEQQVAKSRRKRDLRLQDSDPKWPSMWYLNRGEGLDMNVIPAWMDGITGKGAVVTILDDGLEKDHPDLLQNYDPMASYDVNNHDPDPSPRYDLIDSNRHGTRCAGEVAATSNNSVCALGVAHGAQVGGVRMLDGDVTDAVEARSLSLNPHHIDIYSASWGPDDDGKTVDGPGALAKRAFIEGVTKGRNGKGSIFVWASGNGGRDHDNCNCDGYTNSIYSLSISSATEHGHVPWYSEACSSTLATTYSSGAVGERQVVTTDLRYSCTSSHTGTSASAPLAAGICALALEANPNLTWRDMQHIVVRTARPQNLVAADWHTNGVGRNVSHSFGYGLMDAYAMVKLAKSWLAVPEQHKCEITAPHEQRQIPPKSQVVLQLQVTECEGVKYLEHVEAKLTIQSLRRGDLKIQLVSPMGTRVTLLAHRIYDNSRTGFNQWPFMSVHSWGESPIGTWQLEIHNDGRLLGRATLQNWSLVLYGTDEYPVPMSNSIDQNKLLKSKSNTKKVKNNKKQKNKNVQKNTLTTKLPKTQFKNKIKNTTPKLISSTVYNINSNNNTNSVVKTKKMSKTTTESSPYFYDLSKFKNNEDSVKQYLKFVKNITITYPVMIPARDITKPRDSFKKAPKQKEKSRDINSNRNIKTFTPKSVDMSTTSRKTTTTPMAMVKGRDSASISKWQMTLYGTETQPGAEIRKDVPEFAQHHEKNVSSCVKTNGSLCLGLCVVIVLCYLISSNQLEESFRFSITFTFSALSIIARFISNLWTKTMTLTRDLDSYHCHLKNISELHNAPRRFFNHYQNSDNNKYLYNNYYYYSDTDKPIVLTLLSCNVLIKRLYFHGCSFYMTVCVWLRSEFGEICKKLYRMFRNNNNTIPLCDKLTSSTYYVLLKQLYFI